MGAGHGTVMGKRSVFLESLHRQPRALLREAAAGMGDGNKRNGGTGRETDIPERSRRHTPSTQSGIAPIVERILEGQITRDVPIKSHLPILQGAAQPCEGNAARITRVLPVPPLLASFFTSAAFTRFPVLGSPNIIRHNEISTEALCRAYKRAPQNEHIFHSQTNVPIMGRGIGMQGKKDV